jgi:hypothetical protein
MKQVNLFGGDFAPQEESQKYSAKITAPIYEPKGIKPHLLELYDLQKSRRLNLEIKNSSLSEEEKKFLMFAATRHIVFNYQNIAEYYAHSSKEMQDLMEKSALVIIDFEKAIQLGYVKLCDEIRNQYLEEYGE